MHFYLLFLERSDVVGALSLLSKDTTRGSGSGRGSESDPETSELFGTTIDTTNSPATSTGTHSEVAIFDHIGWF